ncbi:MULTISPECIES: SemiSWEET transporter [Nitrosomonas]|uniref:MtN3 and saliva related transmembrane protein n=2 Tax=Nitrosomonas communis TaxID=44574 RepID=A0A5D3YJ77_9PROT|nr:MULTISPECIES: SemiSWEET transporter [Nitrosomonas]TYP92391.1 MtN3 and saliva related transmembrane protein [Nitrosomonas communis]UVS62801.1 SemiSWEET transporter [Nitrosomonas sp. PLL12]
MLEEMSITVGYIAAFLTTAAFVPQAWYSWRTRDLSGISLPMYTMFTIGVGFWLFYGYLIGSVPVIFANLITFLLSSMVLGMKIQQIMALRFNR